MDATAKRKQHRNEAQQNKATNMQISMKTESGESFRRFG